ncbi:MAG: thioredoxin-disulfide reductase [Desulfatibacillaceae bacterium]|nr:thioredoxin-disulfide reductase [Desulfatibacillaceae bacterium]
MSQKIYDCIIIGGGPAGLTAGIYLARARVDALLLEKVMPGGQIMTSDLVENYPGFPQGISGADLSFAMSQQATNMGLVVESAQVTGVDFSGAVKELVTEEGKYLAKTVIIASGAQPGKLGIPGENIYYGKGVSFCATCDAPFFRDRVVAAVGGGDTAVQESIFLTRFAKKVYLIHRRNALRATKILQERAFSNQRIEMVWDSVATNIEGDEAVRSIGVKNVKTGEEKALAVDGVFVWVGTIPNTDFIKGAVKTDERGFVIADSYMRTSAPGVFAAGDVRNTPLRQVSTAVGDAAIAAFSAGHYLEEHS